MDLVCHYDSPLGRITLAGSGDALTGLWLEGQTHFASTLDGRCEEGWLPVFDDAFRWLDNILVAKDGDRVVGFVGYGHHGPEDPDTGEVFALYVLPEYQGTGVGQRLMDAALEKLSACPHLCLWAVKGNARAIRFYEKNGFRLNGEEKFVPRMEAAGVQMVKER